MKTITYTARVEAIKEIDRFFDALFHSRFPKLCRADKCFDNPEMDILLLKELQGGSYSSLYEQSQDNRADSLGISTRALQDRIRDLENGKDILGHLVKITIDGRGRVAYDSTVHPVLLMLNLKEVYLLTIALRNAFAGTPFEETAQDVSNDVYGQLTEYAKHIIQPHLQKDGLNFAERKPDQRTPYHFEEKDVLYYLKSGERCCLQLLDGTQYFGCIENGAEELVLRTDDGVMIQLPKNRAVYTVIGSE